MAAGQDAQSLNKPVLCSFHSLRLRLCCKEHQRQGPRSSWGSYILYGLMPSKLPVVSQFQENCHLMCGCVTAAKKHLQNVSLMLLKRFSNGMSFLVMKESILFALTLSQASAFLNIKIHIFLCLTCEIYESDWKGPRSLVILGLLQHGSLRGACSLLYTPHSYPISQCPGLHPLQTCNH